MYKKTKFIRIRIKILQFFELIVLPIAIAAVIMLFLFGFAVNILGVRFSSPAQMITILVLIVIFIGGIIFELSRVIIKKILHYPTLDFFERLFKKLFKK
jgi:ABC-type polysaccharide/polyol phosphate export permease